MLLYSYVIANETQVGVVIEILDADEVQEIRGCSQLSRRSRGASLFLCDGQRDRVKREKVR